MSATCEITVNGEPVEIAAGATVAAYLDHLGRDPRAVAIERNGEILPRPRYAETVLRAGDRLEIVQFVQGG